MNRRALLALGAGALALAGRSNAHKLQYSLTDIWWRPDSGRLEIEHSVHLDDAMVLLARLGDPQGELPTRIKAKLMLYLETHFSLVVGDQVLALEPIGAQIDGDYLWMFQEFTLPQLAPAIQVSCTLMQDLFTQQVNQVNLRVADDVRTLRFNREHKLAAFTQLL